jgi:hypothetical protein
MAVSDGSLMTRGVVMAVSYGSLMTRGVVMAVSYGSSAMTTPLVIKLP